MRITVAGTFGPIHDGHRALFEQALWFGDDGVLIALTSDELATETCHASRPIPPFFERKRIVEETLTKLDKWGRDTECRKLTDELGIASPDPTIDALIVSPETVAELKEINNLRREQELTPILGIIVPYILAEDGERISSTRIVKNEVDEQTWNSPRVNVIVQLFPRLFCSINWLGSCM
ncbi:phosphopantetheine adenylyltransferase [Natronococcus wangiae]|uniref:phosphopantetheine adenylyltransferase n=1 Tax=Natronococcus wangiae TaxID=3068275 RepID=UPI0027402EFD|nr:pantetheine-phosphate adenylyltransferase [Natronococcus sp. AD5]